MCELKMKITDSAVDQNLWVTGVLLYRRPGTGIFVETGVRLWDVYHAEQEANSVGRNLVGELFMGLLVVVLQKRGYIGIVDSTGVWHTSVSFEDYFNCTFLYVFDL